MKKRSNLSSAQFQILLALADKKRHGYGIMQEVTQRTAGKVKLGPGTLYGNLKKMIVSQLIEEVEQRPDPQLDDQRRRYYKLTDHGRKTAVIEAQRLAAMVHDARKKQLLPEVS